MWQKEPKSSSIINMTTTIIILTSNRQLTMCQELQDKLHILSHSSSLHNYNISIMFLYFEDGRTNRDLQWLLIISWISASRISTFCPPFASWIPSWPPELLPLTSMPLWKPLPLTVVRTYNLLQGNRIQQRLFFPPTIMLPYVANVKESCRCHEISEQIT